MEKKIETIRIIYWFYWENAKENGNYRDYIGVLLG